MISSYFPFTAFAPLITLTWAFAPISGDSPEIYVVVVPFQILGGRQIGLWLGENEQLAPLKFIVIPTVSIVAVKTIADFHMEIRGNGNITIVK